MTSAGSSQELPTGPEILERLQAHMLDWLGNERLISQLDQNSGDYERELYDARDIAEGIVDDLATCFDFDDSSIVAASHRMDVRGLLPVEEESDAQQA